MAENPYISGEFYDGQYATAQPAFIFREAVRDQRPAFLVEIEGSKETDAIVIKKARASGKTWGYYIRSDGFRIKYGGGANIPMAANQTLWYHTKYDHPAYLVFVDENGDMRYVTFDTDENGSLTAYADPPADTTTNQAQFVGPYMDFLTDDGQKIYRMTVTSDNSIIHTLIGTEAKRTQTLCLSQGMRFAFKAGRLYKEAIIDVADIEQSIEEVEWGYGGVSVPRAGSMSIQLGSKEYDWLATQRWDTRKVTIWSGSTTADPITWPVVFRSQTQEADWDEDRLRITLRDYGTFLDRSIQPNTYAGTGTYEGSADLKGRVKPLGYGSCRHVTPVLIDEEKNVYQVHDGPIEDITLVMDGGVRRTFLDDTSTSILHPTVYDWNPIGSQQGGYLTDRSRGIFRCAAPITNRITVSFIGSTAMDGQHHLSSIIRAIAEARLPEIPLNVPSFDLHADRVPNWSNIYIDQERTIRDVFHELIAPSGGVVYINRLGQLVLRHLEIGTPRVHLLDRDITDVVPFRRLSPPKPGNIYRGGANRVYTTLTDNDLAGNAAEAVKQLLSQEYRYNTVDYSNALDTIKYRRYESAKMITINQPFDFVADAEFWLQGLAHRQQALRDVYEFSVKTTPFIFEVGDCLLLEFPRFGLNVPRPGIIVYVGDRANDRSTVLRVWC